MAEKIAHAVLGDDVETQGGFIEKKNLRFVKKSRNQFHLHPFSQRKFPHRLIEKGAHLQESRKVIDRTPGISRLDPINGPIQFEAFPGREIPNQLILLTEK
jgi:hypothetical protein